MKFIYVREALTEMISSNHPLKRSPSPYLDIQVDSLQVSLLWSCRKSTKILYSSGFNFEGCRYWIERTFIRFCWLPTLDRRIWRNHSAGAFYDFLLGFCHPSKTQYVWRMLVIYFKNGSAIIREQGLHFQVISAKCEYW